MEKVELAVIINSFNRLALLKKSLESLLRELNKTNLNFAVIIFDAGSTDGSVECIENISLSSSLNIKLIKALGKETSSFSYGVNEACRYALVHFKSLKYFLLYETDNYLKSFEPILTSKRLLEDFRDIAACGYTVKKHNGHSTGFGSNFPSVLSFILGQQLSFFFKLNDPDIKWIKNKDYKYSYADVVYTSPLLIKKESWEKVKGLDYINLPFSDCDIDLAYRIKKAGERMAVIYTDEVMHDNLEIKSSWSATRALNFYKARFTYFKKHYGNLVHLLKPLLFLMHLIEFTLLFALMIFGKRKKDSLKTRWILIKSVFVNYRLK